MKKESRNCIMTPSLKITLAIEKQRARFLLKKTRASLSETRRTTASADLHSFLLSFLKSYQAILSFHSLKEEIDITKLNETLALEGKLHLPKIQQKDNLDIYHVINPSKELIPSPFGLLEPDPSQCKLSDLTKIDCILVPALGFDKHHRRIGYGKGHYDKLLTELKKCSFSPRTIGIGFKEQWCDQGLPHEPHDVPLDEVKLF